MADRFYCPGPWPDGRARLDGDEARHLSRARRVAVGEVVSLFDGRGRAATAEVVAIGRDRVDLRVVADEPARGPVGPVVLATAVPKGDRFDWLVEKATELGVTRLVPLLTERSSVDPRPTKLDRVRRLIVEASKQSGRSRLMDLDEPTPWADWLRSDLAGVGARYLAHPGGGAWDDGPRPRLVDGVGLAIGPEGGFTEGEVRSAVDAGFRPVGLGPTILRVETAALSAVASALAWSVVGPVAPIP